MTKTSIRMMAILIKKAFTKAEINVMPTILKGVASKTIDWSEFPCQGEGCDITFKNEEAIEYDGRDNAEKEIREFKKQYRFNHEGATEKELEGALCSRIEAIRMFSISYGSKSENLCPECFERKKNEERLSKLKYIGIPKIHYESRFETFNVDIGDEYDDLRAAALCCTDDYSACLQGEKAWPFNLILAGLCGTGKTHLGVSLINDLIDNGFKSVKYFKYDSILRKEKNSWGSRKAEDRLDITELQRCKLLVIDEIGINEGKFAADLLFEIVGERNDANLPTVMLLNVETSNTREEIDESIQRIMTPRVYSRMMKGNSITHIFSWADYRTK